jgi:transcriptional regulator with XRE-family HTH domain
MLSDLHLPTLRDAIYTERTRRRMPQDQVAATLGCSRKWVSRFERGAAEPTLSFLVAYAGLMGMRLVMDIPEREPFVD